MSVSARQNPLQTYQLILYGRALHTEPFQAKFRGRQFLSKEGVYTVESWIMPGMHAVRFEHNRVCCTEHVTDQDRGIPVGDIITQHLCATEKEYEYVFPRDGVQYLSACQTETLSESLYAEDYEVSLAEGRSQDALIHIYNDDVGRCLSMVAMQKFANEVHVQSCHMVACAGLVIKTQSIFEVLPPGTVSGAAHGTAMIEGKPVVRLSNRVVAGRRNSR